MPAWKQYLYCVITVLVTAGICFGLSGLIGYRVVAFILLVTVSILAITFDILPVLVGAALSAFIWNFFFIPPKFTIHISTTEDTILLIMYFVIAMINAVLTYRIRRVEKISRIREERANSVKLYNTILNSLSHELRTPLAAIISATDNLQTNSHLIPKDREQLIAEISKACLRLNQQVENLLNISRLESGHIQPKNDWCDIVELVYDVVRRVEENNPERKVHISINQEFPLCLLDKGMLDQVIYNLLNNAAIHTETGARIDISATVHGDLLTLIIEDTGSGFVNGDVKDVFDKFSRSKTPTTARRGLGLSIVKGFTEAMSGNVDLERVHPSGSRFVITIPVKSSSIKLAEYEPGRNINR
jgi:two-component system, OmpR family, sensor histidine kinase KdpD